MSENSISKHLELVTVEAYVISLKDLDLETHPVLQISDRRKSQKRLYLLYHYVLCFVRPCTGRRSWLGHRDAHR